jgi:hypothetical protein
MFSCFYLSKASLRDVCQAVSLTFNSSQAAQILFSIILEKLCSPTVGREVSHFVEPDGLLSCSREPAICPYLKPDESTLQSASLSF